MEKQNSGQQSENTRWDEGNINYGEINYDEGWTAEQTQPGKDTSNPKVKKPTTTTRSPMNFSLKLLSKGGPLHTSEHNMREQKVKRIQLAMHGIIAVVALGLAMAELASCDSP